MDHCAPVLVTSMLTTLMSRIRCYLSFATKNKLLADKLTPVFRQIAEQLLPYYCTTVSDNHAHVNKVHHLVFLLTQKVKDSFYSGVIRGCLDQNWSLKGLRQALIALLKTLSITDCKEPLAAIETQIKSQNLQSQSCVIAFAQQVRQTGKEIDAQALQNLVQNYETDFCVIKEEVEKFRGLNLPQSFISTINSWAYDLKKFDLKLTMANDLTKLIQSSLQSVVSQVFWTSYFKCQSSVTTDDFFEAIREVCSFAQLSDFYESQVQHYEEISRRVIYRLTLKNNAQIIQEIIDTIAEFRQGIDFFRTMSKFTATKQSTLSIALSAESSLSASQYLSQLVQYNNLKHLRLGKLSQVFSTSKLQKAKHEPAQLRLVANCQLQIELTQSDQTITVVFQGDTQIYRIGEGDSNDLQIPNEKQMWECQLNLISFEGAYYARDCGRVHPTRIQVKDSLFLKLQKHTVIDFGNCIQFVVDFVTHNRRGTQTISEVDRNRESEDLIVLQPDRQDKMIESSKDLPTLRMRLIWISPNNEVEIVPKEIIFEATADQRRFQIGRSSKSDSQVNLKELSSEHCFVEYSEIYGWILTESYNQRPSSNGTHVFLKSHLEMQEQAPSSLLMVRDGMALSFVNYTVSFKLLPTSTTVLARESQALESNHNEISNLHQTQKDFSVPGALNLESAIDLSSPGSQTSKSQTRHQVQLRKLNVASHCSQETPAQTQVNFSQHLKEQLINYSSQSSNGMTSFLVKEVNIRELNQQSALEFTNNSQPSHLNGFSPVNSGQSLQGNNFLNSQVISRVQAKHMEDKVNQCPSDPALLKRPEKTYNVAQTSTSFEVQKTHQEIAAQTEVAPQRQMDTQTLIKEYMDAETTGLHQIIQELATQTEFKDDKVAFEEFGVQTDSVLEFGLANQNASDLSNFQSKLNIVPAISLTDIPLQTVRANLDVDSIAKEDEISVKNDRYHQETLQQSRVPYVFVLGKEDNKIAPDSSDTE